MNEEHKGEPPDQGLDPMARVSNPDLQRILRALDPDDKL